MALLLANFPFFPSPIFAAPAFTVLHDFGASDGVGSLSNLLQGTDGNFYGTTVEGGAYGLGTVFKMTSSGTVTILHTFDKPSDSEPPSGFLALRTISALIEGTGEAGNFYGTTGDGGAYNLGTVFKIKADGSFITLYSFGSHLSADSRNALDGSSPSSSLVQGDDGNFYGTTVTGGENGYGTVFKITPNGVLTTLYSFTNDSNGEFPNGGLVKSSDGMFYGTTTGNIDINNPIYGTVFRVTSTGQLTTLHSFDGADGSWPVAALLAAKDGNFYGTTEGGGVHNDGTLFKITSDGTFGVLYSFSNSDGREPTGSLVQDTDGNIYGTTRSGIGDTSYGTIFRITPAENLTTVYVFTAGDDGGSPYAGLTLGRDGNFYGTTSSFGANSGGTAFRVTQEGTLTVLHVFGGTSNEGSGPRAGLVRDSAGNFYGTTYGGGQYRSGTVFKLTPDGKYSSIHSFGSQNSEGTKPVTNLAISDDGNLYGATISGGSPLSGTYTVSPCTVQSNGGTAFKISPGRVSAVHDFHGCDGYYPTGGLVKASDGSVYGTTSRGGPCLPTCEPVDPQAQGTIYKIATDGTFAQVYTFTGLDGSSPSAELVQGFDGALYGTTSGGGASNMGTIYKLKQDGILTSLYSFSGQDGAFPSSALVLASDGSFYGTTSRGGTNDKGTVFKITSDGTLSTLYSFRGDDGEAPLASLIQAGDGSLYGTTSLGGQSNDGTVFQLTPAGALTTIHSFGGNDGSSPQASLTSDADGNLYGTTYAGGKARTGTVFKITLVPSKGGGSGGGAIGIATLIALLTQFLRQKSSRHRMYS